ncbi:MAG: hypothetical protein F6K65_43895 [Moorea sp. SIO3C2]|nr:hypothetical protein [Moorena sp. SIO3C2]
MSDKDTLQQQVTDGKAAKQRAQILEIALKHGIEPDEPFWLVFQATGQLETLLLKLPGDLKAIAKAVGVMGKKHETALAEQKKMQEQQTQTVRAQKEVATLTASVASNVSSENCAQWHRTLIATAGWAFFGIIATHMFHVLVPWSPYSRALQTAGEAEEALEIVEAYGTPLSAWSWVLNKTECIKQAEADGTNKCTVEL